MRRAANETKANKTKANKTNELTRPVVCEARRLRAAELLEPGRPGRSWTSMPRC